MTKKVLIFTSAWGRRPLMTRQCMLSVMAQSYKDLVHAVNITLDGDATTKDYSPMYNDLVKLDNRFIVNTNLNGHTHHNNMLAIKSVPNFMEYDYFLKMDNDDIYKTHYVENIVNFFEANPDVDITSTKITDHLNGYDLYKGSWDNFGANPDGTDYHMPMTFAFTRKALESIIGLTNIYGFDDMMWRDAWAKDGLKHKAVHNENEVIFNVHGGNVSTGSWLKKK
jgi:hypothetical protein